MKAPLAAQQKAQKAFDAQAKKAGLTEKQQARAKAVANILTKNVRDLPPELNEVAAEIGDKMSMKNSERARVIDNIHRHGLAFSKDEIEGIKRAVESGDPKRINDAVRQAVDRVAPSSPEVSRQVDQIRAAMASRHQQAPAPDHPRPGGSGMMN